MKKLKKNNKLPIVIVGVVVLLGAGYLLMNRGVGPGPGPMGMGGMGKGAGGSGGDNFSGTLKAAIALGTPMKCKSSIETDDGTAIMEGIIQGNNYKGESMVDGKMSNILMKGECMWAWVEGEENGFKMCYELAEGETSAWGDYDAEMLDDNVNCSPTIAGPGTFDPPSNVTFFDMDEMMSGELSPEEMEQLERMGE